MARSKREISNVDDLYAISVIKHGTGTVGHLPKRISTPYHLILRKGESISCIVNGRRLGRCQYLRYFHTAILKLPKYFEIIFSKMAYDFRNVRKQFHSKISTYTVWYYYIINLNGFISYKQYMQTTPLMVTYI